MLVTAEKRLAAGDPKGAQQLAQAALDKKIGDQGRALFILAEVAVANKNRDGAQENFQKAIAAFVQQQFSVAITRTNDFSFICLIDEIV